MIRVRDSKSLAAVCGAACAAIASGCLAPAPEAAVSDAHAVAVEPRVVMDGAVELGQRAGGRILVDEVLFHAPAVGERRGGKLADVLATDPEGAAPLLFRYDIASNDGFGDVLGGERSWVLHGGDDDSALEFSFAPFALEDSARARLEDAAGVYLGDLVGHTAYVHGYVAMSAQGTGFGNECDGDPDGNPADCERADGDPDGNPAGPTPENDGDPDGNPAKPRSSQHDFQSSDDGAAEADPADGDPDGNPAKPGHHGFGDEELTVQGTPFDDEHVNTTRVPFVLLLDSAFALQVPVAELLDVELDAERDEVLPIDLHVSLAELFTVEQVGALVEQAAHQRRGAVVMQVSGTTALGIDVRTAGVRRAAESATTGGIRVTGDLR